MTMHVHSFPPTTAIPHGRKLNHDGLSFERWFGAYPKMFL